MPAKKKPTPTKQPAKPAVPKLVKRSADEQGRIDRILTKLDGLYHGMETALDYNTDFELLIAVMLSAQTTDVYVNKVTPGLFAKYPTPAAMAAAELEEVERLIGGVSFYKTKARNVIATSRILVEQFGGKVPPDHAALTAMPGVGNKTANVVVSTLFRIPAIAVDTHVFRVSNRLGLATAGNVEETERQLQQTIPMEKWYEAHHWLIWHGRKICKAPTPRCEICPLTPECRWYQTHGGNAPVAKAAPGKTVKPAAPDAAGKSAGAIAKAAKATKAKSATAKGTTPPAKATKAKPKQA